MFWCRSVLFFPVGKRSLTPSVTDHLIIFMGEASQIFPESNQRQLLAFTWHLCVWCGQFYDWGTWPLNYQQFKISELINNSKVLFISVSLQQRGISKSNNCGWFPQSQTSSSSGCCLLSGNRNLETVCFWQGCKNLRISTKSLKWDHMRSDTPDLHWKSFSVHLFCCSFSAASDLWML